jgi:hypothetical protein
MTARTLLSKLVLHFPSSSIKVETSHTYDRPTNTFSRSCSCSITTPGPQTTPRRRKSTFTGPSYGKLLSEALRTLPPA